MVKVEIRCPACSKRGYIDVAHEIINESVRGVTAVNVGENQICSHSFVAYIDKNFAIRDCFIADFQIELPSIEIEQKIEDFDLPGPDIVDVDLIKINLPALTLTYMLRAFFFKKKLLLLYDGEFLHRHIEKFFKFVSRNSFDSEVRIEETELYKKSKKHFKDYIVLNTQKVLNDKGKTLDPKKIKIERMIVQKFLAEYNAKSSLIIIKNDIQRAFELAKQIIEIIETYKGDEKLGKKKLIDQYAENSGNKISFSYLEFLLDIMKNYFNFDLSMLSDYYFPAFGI